MSLARADNETLTTIVLRCFDLSMHGGVPATSRSQFLALGKRLRGTLINLLSAQFDSQTPQFLEANQKIAEVNSALQETAKDLARLADTMEEVDKLIKMLDDLLAIAVRFV